MERPPLGGEGYQRDVDSLIDIFDGFFQSREKSYPLDGATTKGGHSQEERAINEMELALGFSIVMIDKI